MLTKEQAINEHEFHAGTCKRTIGPRGGVTTKQEVWRRNGKTQTWKTRPEAFRVPVKYGLYQYSNILEWDAKDFHVASDCPLLKPYPGERS